MAKFVELPVNGEKMIINIDTIELILQLSYDENSCKAWIGSNCCKINKPYEEIKKMLLEAEQ